MNIYLKTVRQGPRVKHTWSLGDYEDGVLYCCRNKAITAARKWAFANNVVVDKVLYNYGNKGNKESERSTDSAGNEE